MNDRVFKDHSLYDFWKEGIVRYFKDTDVIINLASNEYAKLLSATYSSNMVTISFLVEKKGGLKSISVVSKQQRGKLLHWMIQNHITEVSDIKKYTQDNFLFDKEKSDTQNYIFIKES